MMIEAILTTIENEQQRSELSEFYQKYNKRLYAIALSRLHSEIDAEDAVQEVFARIADKPEKFFNIEPNGRVAYADVMVRNISIKMFNTKSNEPIEQLDIDELEIETVSLADFVLDKISHDEVMKSVNRLPTMQRSVLIMRCLVGMSIDEAARQLNISVNAANKHLKAARKAVKKFIDERGN